MFNKQNVGYMNSGNEKKNNKIFATTTTKI